jgi:hypothetical protein
MEVLTEWGVNIYKFKIDENEKILDEIMKHRRDIDFNVNREWNAKVSQILSNTKTNKEFNILVFLKNKIENYISRIPNCKGLTLCTPPHIKPDLWINMYKKGDYQGAHRHMYPNNIKYSLVYFAKYNPDTDAKLMFGNPNTTELILMSGEIKIIEKKFIPVNEGEVILFPSYLPHCVEKHESDTERITVSGNLYSF